MTKKSRDRRKRIRSLANLQITTSWSGGNEEYARKILKYGDMIMIGYIELRWAESLKCRC